METEHNTLCNGLSKAAWGYFFLNFDINLGVVSILPRFVGYLLLSTAVSRLAEERKNLLLLSPLCQLLILYSLADWILSWVGTKLEGRFLFLDLLATAAGLYFHFQFLTDMAALAERVETPGMILDSSIRTRRNMYVVLTTVLGLLAYILPAEKLETLEAGSIILLLLALVACIAALAVMFGLFSLRKCVENSPEISRD